MRQALEEGRAATALELAGFMAGLFVAEAFAVSGLIATFLASSS